MGPGGLRQGKVRSQEVTTSTLDTPSTSRSISPEKSAQIFTHIGRFCMRAVDLMQSIRAFHTHHIASYYLADIFKLGPD